MPRIYLGQLRHIGVCEPAADLSITMPRIMTPSELQLFRLIPIGNTGHLQTHFVLKEAFYLLAMDPVLFFLMGC